MDLLYFLKVLFRKKWIIIGLSILSAVAAFFFLVNKKPLYTSLAQYSTGFTSEKIKLVDGTAAIDLYTVDVKFDNVIETIKSPQVLSRISYSVLLHDLLYPNEAYKRLTPGEKQKPIYKAVNIDSAKIILAQKLSQNELLSTDLKSEENLLKYLKLYKYDYLSILENLGVNRVARTDYLDIIYNSENPKLSARVVNSIGPEFLNYYKGLNLKRTDESAQSIKDLLKNQQNKVDSLGQKLLDEKISQGTIDPISRTTSAMETVTELETRLADEKGKYNEHYNRYSYLTVRLNTLQTTGSTGGTNDEVVRLTKKRNDLVEELSNKGGSDATLERQISDLRNEILLKSSTGTSKSKQKDVIDDLTRQISEESALMNASKSTIEDYEGRIKRYMGMTNVNPGSGVKMDAIRTQLDMENKQLGNVKDMYNQVQGLAKDDPTSDFIQTRVGQPSTEPESKKTIVKMALAGTSIFFLTSIFFIFLEIFDSSIKTPSIFRKLLRSNASTVINQINLKKADAATVIFEDYEGNKNTKSAIFKNNIRKLRYELLNSGKQIFLFTSTQKKTGKTTIIQALAASLLLSKKKVLVIDMNFAHNGLTENYNSNVYIEDVVQNVNESLPLDGQKIVGETSQEDLFIIGCKQGNTTPSEVLYNVDMPKLIRYFKNNFDYILIEGAALNNFADSKELSQYADGVFTVFSAENTVQAVDAESMKFIADLKEKNQGLILNKVLTENTNS